MSVMMDRPFRGRTSAFPSVMEKGDNILRRKNPDGPWATPRRSLFSCTYCHW